MKTVAKTVPHANVRAALRRPTGLSVHVVGATPVVRVNLAPSRKPPVRPLASPFWGDDYPARR